jgi:hypothetical protein
MGKAMERILTLLVLAAIAGGIWYYLRLREERLIAQHPEIHLIYQALPDTVDRLLAFPKTAHYPSFATFIDHCRYEEESGLYRVSSYVESKDEFKVTGHRSFVLLASVRQDSVSFSLVSPPHRQ